MIDHVSVPVRDLNESTAFYESVLFEIGFAKLAEKPGTVGFGKRYPEFWLKHEEARKCPHCNQWLGKAMVLIYASAIIIPLVFLAFFAIWPFSALRAGSDPAELVSHIAVVGSSFRFSTAGESTYVTTVGTVRNDSEDIAVDDIYIEVQYFNSESALIDAKGAEQYGLVLLPGSEAAFRVQVRASSPESEYASHQVFIRSAKEARRLF